MIKMQLIKSINNENNTGVMYLRFTSSNLFIALKIFVFIVSSKNIILLILGNLGNPNEIQFIADQT